MRTPDPGHRTRQRVTCDYTVAARAIAPLPRPPGFSSAPGEASQLPAHVPLMLGLPAERVYPAAAGDLATPAQLIRTDHTPPMGEPVRDPQPGVCLLSRSRLAAGLVADQLVAARAPEPWPPGPGRHPFWPPQGSGAAAPSGALRAIDPYDAAAHSGGPTAGAACGGSLSLTWWPLTLVPQGAVLLGGGHDETQAASPQPAGRAAVGDDRLGLAGLIRQLDGPNRHHVAHDLFSAQPGWAQLTQKRRVSPVRSGHVRPSVR
jgi:hypothetical protein